MYINDMATLDLNRDFFVISEFWIWKILKFTRSSAVWLNLNSIERSQHKWLYVKLIDNTLIIAQISQTCSTIELAHFFDQKLVAVKLKLVADF